jgi:hypothetical protein
MVDIFAVKSVLGKRVNIHLVDGSVIVNVKAEEINRNNEKYLVYSYGDKKERINIKRIVLFEVIPEW